MSRKREQEENESEERPPANKGSSGGKTGASTLTFSTQSSKKARPVSLSLTKVHSSMKRMKIWVLVSCE